ncbi:hypothetical protein [Microbulbifer sp. SSSA008]|uniref:hypothetical protein n=1 Tax=unclassified Microbulbifer TaxID=2619833 RepID=UPI00403A2871
MQFEVKPKIGIGPVKLGMNRSEAIKFMGVEPESFIKTPTSVHATDAFYSSGFQIFYEGSSPKVESIELSRDSGFEILMSGIKVLNLPVPQSLEKIQEITGLVPHSEDDGYTFEIPDLGLWLWRPVTESPEGKYFETIGIGKPNT